MKKSELIDLIKSAIVNSEQYMDDLEGEVSNPSVYREYRFHEGKVDAYETVKVMIIF